MFTDTFLMICCMTYSQIVNVTINDILQIDSMLSWVDFRNRSQMTSKYGNNLFLPRFNIG